MVDPQVRKEIDDFFSLDAIAWFEVLFQHVRPDKHELFSQQFKKDDKKMVWIDDVCRKIQVQPQVSRFYIKQSKFTLENEQVGHQWRHNPLQ